VVLDDFGHSLDTVTRASCAVCAARAAREHSLCLVVATALPDVASWLQPDVVLQLPPRLAAFSSSPAVVLNEGAGTRPEVRIAVRLTCVGGLSEQQGLSSTNQPLPSQCTRSHTYGATEAGFKCDPSAEQTLHGGVVVVTSVDCDDATSMCNQLFDTQFTGETAVRVPDFPSVPALGEFWVGLIVGPSGSGKSLIRRHVFGDGTVSQMQWPAGVTVEGLFDSVEECTARLAAVGLDADGIRAVPHANLSRGETHLVAVARLLVGSRGGGSTPSQGVLPIVCLDEFTCALDRAAAGALARGVADWARRQCTARYVVMTCHDDLDGALAPDWVYHTSLRTCYWRKRDLPCREDLHSGMLTSSNLAPRPPLRVAERLQLALATVGRSGAIVASVARPTLCLHLRQCALSAWQVSGVPCRALGAVPLSGAEIPLLTRALSPPRCRSFESTTTRTPCCLQTPSCLWLRVRREGGQWVALP
jgi:ABC-type iron transport system FetAB ATPase subunit